MRSKELFYFVDFQESDASNEATATDLDYIANELPKVTIQDQENGESHKHEDCSLVNGDNES